MADTAQVVLLLSRVKPATARTLVSEPVLMWPSPRRPVSRSRLCMVPSMATSGSEAISSAANGLRQACCSILICSMGLMRASRDRPAPLSNTTARGSMPFSAIQSLMVRSAAARSSRSSASRCSAPMVR